MQIILDHFFGKSRLEDISAESINALVSKYPYLNVARFIHVMKSGSAQEVEKHPGLFFNNPLWFEFLLQEQEQNTDLPMEVDLVVDRKDLVGALQEEEIEGDQEQLLAGNDSPKIESAGGESEQVQTADAASEAGNQPLTGASSGEDDLVEGISKVARQQINTPVSTLNNEESFTFEPYHTIDYFASQGIRLQQADLSRDKFGKQLKSFTEWLKSMKRLPDSNQAPVDLEAQEKVVRIAEHSIENKDVYTEAMAEVWAKQGNYKKAADIYRKLSLINPAKSPYFAAKIEQLNNL